MKVLFVVGQFPPLNIGGSFRPLKFVKYLPDFGIDPLIVTLDEASVIQEYGETLLDRQLLEELPESVRVYRLPIERARARSRWRTYFEVHDDFALRWKSAVLPFIEKIIERESPTILFTSLPPFSLGALATQIAGKHDLPLVVDLRDAWSQWCITPYRSWLHYFLTKARERKVLGRATAAITTTPQTREKLLALHPLVSKDKIHCLYNGFDFPMEEVADRIQWPSLSEKERFTIGYVGTYYFVPAARENMLKPRWHRMLQFAPHREDWLYRTPYFFFKALASLFERNPKLRNSIKYRHIGQVADWFPDMVRQFQLEPNVEITGFVPYQKVPVLLEECDAFLATSAKVIGGQDYSLASKTFDYMRFGRPIIGFVTEGIQKVFLQQSGFGLIVDPDDEAAADRLEQLFVNAGEQSTDIKFLSQFQRRESARRLAEIMRQVASSTMD